MVRDPRFVSPVRAWVLVAVATTLLLLVMGLAVAFLEGGGGGSKSAQPSASLTQSPTEPSSPTTTDDTRQSIQKQLDALIPTDANLLANPLTEDKGDPVVLEIGYSPEFQAQLQSLLPGATPYPGTPLKVLSKMRAQLKVDPGEAMVDQPIQDQSSADSKFHWTWIVHPIKPMESLHVVAEISVILADNTLWSPVDIPRDIPIKSSIPFEFDHFLARYGPLIGGITGVLTIAGAIKRKSIADFWRNLRKKKSGAENHDDASDVSVST